MPAELAAALADTAPGVLARLSLAGNATAPAVAGGPVPPPPHQHGDAVWLEPYGDRPPTVINTRTGASWQRNPAGWWEPAAGGPPALGLVDQLAALLASPEDQVDAIAALLRQEVRAPGELLMDAQRAALGARRGADPARLHVVRSEVVALLERTDPTPHRIVEEVTDLDALVASCVADAETADQPKWATLCADQRDKYAARGPGRFTFPFPFSFRAAALVDLGRHLRWLRPGQAFLVEPIGAR
jgi:hypothetical protein